MHKGRDPNDTVVVGGMIGGGSAILSFFMPPTHSLVCRVEPVSADSCYHTN